MNCERRSPVTLPGRPARSEKRDGWNVVLEYEGESGGPLLIDLSHGRKWDLQDVDIARFKPFGMSIPDDPGQSRLENGILINRMGRTQASIWRLSEQVPDDTADPAFTETTEGQLLLALAGPNIFSITEKLTSLEFDDSSKVTPFLLFGPFSHVPCQTVVLSRSKRDGVLLLACSRGYGRDMTHAILEAGREFRLKPGGENGFAAAMKEIAG
ncbi:MAG: hypothetical protein P4L55_00575 [Syntrophobacteraceae bacterium]|nr:hypothetical protein [Syntrophobacteraceae bacterium]